MNLPQFNLSNFVLALLVLISISLFIYWIMLIINEDAVVISKFYSFVLEYFNDDLASQIDSCTLISKLNHLLPMMKVGIFILFILIILWIAVWILSKRYFSGYKKDTQYQSVNSTVLNKNTVLIFSITALIIRLINFNQSLWLDEIISAANYFGNVSFYKTLIATQFNNHIFYSIFAYLSGLFFDFDWAYRLPSLIIGVISIFAIARLTSQFNNKFVVLFSIALITLSPIHIDQSQQARGYTLLVLSVIISSFLFYQLFSNSKRSYWIWYTLVNIIGIWTHLYMIFVIISQFCVFILYFISTKPIKNKLSSIQPNSLFLSFTIIGLTSIILYLPSLPYLLYSFFSESTPNTLLEYSFVFTMLKSLSVGEYGGGFAILYFGLFTLGMWQLYRVDWKLLFYIILSFLFPLVIVGITQPVFLYPRFFIFLLPLFIVAVSFGMAFIAKMVPVRIRSIVVVVFLCSIILTNWNSINKIITWDRQNYREAGEVIKSYSPDSTVLAVPGYAEGAISYYIPNYKIVVVNSIEEVHSLAKIYGNLLFLVTFNYNLDNEIIKFFHEERKVVSHQVSRYGFVIVYRYLI